MRGIFRGFTIAVFVAAALAAVPSPAVSAEESREKVQAELAAKKALANELARKSKKIDAEVKNLSSRLVKTAAELRESEENLAGSEAEIRKLQLKKDKLLKNLYAQQADAGGLIAAARRFKSTPTSEIILQGDPVDAARTSLIMKSIIPRMQQESALMRKEIDALADVEKTLSRQQKEVESKINKIKKKNNEIEVLVKGRKELYAQTDGQRKAEEEAVQKLAAKAKSLDELVAKIEAAERAEKDTKTAAAPRPPRNLPAGMVLPVSGKIETAFGETDLMGAKSRGMTFSVRPASTVVTPLAGRVKFAGPFQKYKQILIVEHADSYHSLIAGLGSIDTVVGARLAAGEPVGSAETTSGEAFVYYELRHKGAPVNPSRRLAEQKKQDKNRS